MAERQRGREAGSGSRRKGETERWEGREEKRTREVEKEIGREGRQERGRESNDTMFSRQSEALTTAPLRL